MSDLSDTLPRDNEYNVAAWRIGSATGPTSRVGKLDDDLAPAAGLFLGLAISTVIWLGVATAVLRFW